MLLVADSHVHWYPEYDHALFLGVASRHLTILAGGAPATRLLFLTERADCHIFHPLLDGSLILPDGWSVHPLDEPMSCELRNPAHDPILLIAGRQTVTREGLEVLSLGTTETFEDGCEIRSVLESCSKAGGFPVLPWSFGKWFGARGKLVSSLVTDPHINLAVGDPSHRPRGWREPDAFRTARALRRLILPGSDPLPCPHEEYSVARYGLKLEVPIDILHPWTSLRPRFLYGDSPFQPVGQRDGFIRFVKRQIALRREHARRKAEQKDGMLPHTPASPIPRQGTSNDVQAKPLTTARADSQDPPATP